MASRLPENDSRPLRQNATRIHSPVLREFLRTDGRQRMKIYSCEEWDGGTVGILPRRTNAGKAAWPRATAPPS
jgi:hypothetical protein